ncbi:GNAT family N-acetyltransferase [Christiangramia salexigens]|uniref:N-acetyltransferase n=1 Tax=Christiangramia salexigens TaxID=1913577 RepID=A0A1L3J3M6_9FLAO|nr:N-acetyltransferase [Christiangramia salexigens]APG59727.1 N-acetyltransferase [Christiangramia salexigens]
MSTEELKITDNEFLRQFETYFNDDLATIEYSQQERKIFLTKLMVPEEHTDKQEDFIKAVLEIIKERNTRVVPTSSEIASFMRKNRRKYKDLLPVGINI